MHDPVPSLAERIKDMSWDEAVQRVMYLESHRRPSSTAADVDPDCEGGIAFIRTAFVVAPVVAYGSFGTGLPPCAAIERAHQKMGVKMGPADGSMPGYPLFWENGLLRGRKGRHTIMLRPNFIGAVTFSFGFRSGEIISRTSLLATNVFPAMEGLRSIEFDPLPPGPPKWQSHD